MWTAGIHPQLALKASTPCTCVLTSASQGCLLSGNRSIAHGLLQQGEALSQNTVLLQQDVQQLELTKIISCQKSSWHVWSSPSPLSSSLSSDSWIYVYSDLVFFRVFEQSGFVFYRLSVADKSIVVVVRGKGVTLPASHGAWATACGNDLLRKVKHIQAAEKEKIEQRH